MGLDMYVFKTRRKLDKEVDFGSDKQDEKIHYWRKHPDLHGWMEELYRSKGGKEADFNLTGVILSIDDLALLETQIECGVLPGTSGFFFGESDGSERDDDLLFIEKARNLLSDGWTLYYTSWW